MFVMYTADRVIATLRAHEAEMRQAGLRSLSLFGSVARGETETDSDIDLAAEFDPAAWMDLLRLTAPGEAHCPATWRPGGPFARAGRKTLFARSD
jgi:hypothetical protein